MYVFVQNLQFNLEDSDVLCSSSDVGVSNSTRRDFAVSASCSACAVVVSNRMVTSYNCFVFVE